MALNIDLKPAYQTKIVSFNNSAAPLGSRSDLDKLILLAYRSNRTDYLAMFNNPPSEADLVAAGVTIDQTDPVATPPVTPLVGNVWNLPSMQKKTLVLSADKTLQVVSVSGNRGSLLVTGAGYTLTLTEGGFTQTIQTAATGNTLVEFANFDGNRTVWVDNGRLPVEMPVLQSSAVDFDTDKQYGSVSAPRTGALTAGTATQKNGVTATIIHNAAQEPAYPGSNWKKTDGCGTYTANATNYIIARAFGSGEVHILSIYKIQ